MVAIIAIQSSKGTIIVFEADAQIGANLPTANNNWNWNTTGNNAIIKDIWSDLQAGLEYRYDVTANFSIDGTWNGIKSAFQDIQQVVQIVGSIASLL